MEDKDGKGNRPQRFGADKDYQSSSLSASNLWVLLPEFSAPPVPLRGKSLGLEVLIAAAAFALPE
jgi:hypothetical protein